MHGKVVIFSMVFLMTSCHSDPVSPHVLTITNSSGEVLKIKVELARTEAERARGFMHRKRLADGEGMLFLFPAETTAPFWMKDTPISLDLIFIKGKKIVALIEEATPNSEELLLPDLAYEWVLEVPAGTVSRHRIKLGDRMEPPL